MIHFGITIWKTDTVIKQLTPVSTYSNSIKHQNSNSLCNFRVGGCGWWGAGEGSIAAFFLSYHESKNPIEKARED